MWLVWVVLVLIVFEVVSRRLLGAPHKWAYEVITIFYAIHFMTLAAYTLLYKAHVSIDIFYLRLSQRGQAVVDIFTYLVLFMPFMYVLIKVGIGSAATSWGMWERTQIGLPLVFPVLKTMTPLAAVLLLLQGLSDFIQRLMFAVKGVRFDS